MIFLQQFGLEPEPPFFEDLLQIREHSLANARDREHLLRLTDQVCDLLRKGLDRLSGVAIGTDAKGILPVDFEQIGSLVQDVGDGFVVHGYDEIVSPGELNKVGRATITSLNTKCRRSPSNSRRYAHP